MARHWQARRGPPAKASMYGVYDRRGPPRRRSHTGLSLAGLFLLLAIAVAVAAVVAIRHNPSLVPAFLGGTTTSAAVSGSQLDAFFRDRSGGRLGVDGVIGVIFGVGALLAGFGILYSGYAAVPATEERVATGGYRTAFGRMAKGPGAVGGKVGRGVMRTGRGVARTVGAFGKMVGAGTDPVVRLDRRVEKLRRTAEESVKQVQSLDKEIKVLKRKGAGGAWGDQVLTSQLHLRRKYLRIHQEAILRIRQKAKALEATRPEVVRLLGARLKTPR